MGTFPNLAQASHFQECRRAAWCHRGQGDAGVGSGKLGVYKDTWLRAKIELIQMATTRILKVGLNWPLCLGWELQPSGHGEETWMGLRT